MEKFYTSKTFLKMADGRMHIPHPTPLDSPLAISYRNHQKNLAYFSHLDLIFQSPRSEGRCAVARFANILQGVNKLENVKVKYGIFNNAFALI